ncbi:MAG: guanylate kinase [Candidatus Omnitrophica bacterium 4484_70.1]|nr:MAG: guanylate kinase [Candidatus Omnitrophica bacterium 4484_70.1]
MRLFIISGPAGAGKTTLLKRLFKKKFIRDNFLRTVSFTTRSKREIEVEGRDYFFVTKKDFLEKKKKKFFLETQKVLDDYYGTPRYFLKKAKKEGKDLILCIDVKGGKYLKKNFKEGKIITIFISVDKKELYYRLKKRKEKRLKEKLKLAEKEMEYLNYYDYLVVNENVEKSLKDLEAILKAERLKIR